MAGKFLPPLHPIARAIRGWPSDRLTNPTVPAQVNWAAVPGYVKLKALVIATNAGLFDLVSKRFWTQSGMVSQATANGLGYATSAGTNDHAEGPIQYTYSGGDFGGEVSVVHDFLCNAATGSSWRTLLALDGTGYNQGPFIQVNETSALFEIYYNSTNRVQHTTGAYPTAGESYRYGFSHKVGANAVYWGANKTYSSKTPSPNVGASGTGYPRLGSEDILNRGIGGSHRLFAIFAGALDQVDLERLVDAPYALIKPANDTTFLIGSAAAGGTDYDETLSQSVTSSAAFAETYEAPDYVETLAQSVTSSASSAETYNAPDYVETLSQSVTSSAALAESYVLGAAYEETLSESVTSSAALAESWTVDYDELLAQAVTSSAAMAEDYATGGAPTLSAPIYNSVTANSATVGCTVTF